MLVSRWVLVVAWAAVIFSLSAVPNLSTGLGGWDYVLRKCAHTAEYAVLAVLVLRACGSFAWAWAGAVAYAATDEFHQTFVRGRHGSPIDVGIDAVGAALGLGVWAWLRSPARSR